MIAAQKVRNCAFSCGVSPGFSRLPWLRVAQREVHVLAGAVDTVERLLVQQAGHPVALGHLLQGGHHQLLMIMGQVGLLEQRGDLELTGRDLVVPGLGQDALLEQLAVDLDHEGQHPLRDGAEVVIIELLALGRLGAEQGPAGAHQVRAGVVEVLVDQEVLLLRTGEGHHGVDVGVAEQLQQPGGLRAHRLLRPQQRRLLVQRLAGPGDEDRRDAQGVPVRVLQDVRRAGHVPAGVAAGLEGAADAAVGEARAVRLALGQGLAGELGQRAAVGVRLQEGVVLLRGQTGQRVEDVGVVRGAVLQRPVPHGRGHRVGDRRIERGALLDRGQHRVVDVLGQPALHPGQVEDVLAEQLAERLGEVLVRDLVRRHGLDGVVPGGASTHGAPRVRGLAGCGETVPDDVGGVRVRMPRRSLDGGLPGEPTEATCPPCFGSVPPTSQPAVPARSARSPSRNG